MKSELGFDLPLLIELLQSPGQSLQILPRHLPERTHDQTRLAIAASICPHVRAHSYIELSPVMGRSTPGSAQSNIALLMEGRRSHDIRRRKLRCTIRGFGGRKDQGDRREQP